MLYNRSLGEGGAERQLVTTACAMKARGLPVAVMVLYGGPMRAELDQAGVTVIELEKKSRWDFSFLARMIRALRSWRPDAIYCFGGAMLFAVAVKPFLNGAALIWGIRASKMGFQFYSLLSRLLIRIQPFLARRARLIICNSEMGKQHVVDMGFPTDRTVVVPNGINTEKWAFNNDLRVKMRETWGIGQEQKLVGIVARIDPIKDHKTFIKMAALCHKSRPDLKFVLIGGDTDPAYTKGLQDLAMELLDKDAVIWAGNCADMKAAYSALDVLVLTSLAEGFPNAIGEGMACGLKVVSTDAGDARSIIADTGYVTDVGDVDGLAKSVLSVLDDQSQPPYAPARDRIVANYSVDALLDRTLGLINEATRSRKPSMQE